MDIPRPDQPQKFEDYLKTLDLEQLASLALTEMDANKLILIIEESINRLEKKKHYPKPDLCP